MTEGLATVYFDGKCGICNRLKSLVQKLDRKGVINFYDLWEVKRSNQFSQEELAREMHLVTRDGEVYLGYFAIKKIILLIAEGEIIKFFMDLSVIDRIGKYIYKIISRNRGGFIMCQNCKLKPRTVINS